MKRGEFTACFGFYFEYLIVYSLSKKCNLVNTHEKEYLCEEYERVKLIELTPAQKKRIDIIKDPDSLEKVTQKIIDDVVVQFPDEECEIVDVIRCDERTNDKADVLIIIRKADGETVNKKLGLKLCTNMVTLGNYTGHSFLNTYFNENENSKLKESIESISVWFREVADNKEEKKKLRKSSALRNLKRNIMCEFSELINKEPKTILIRLRTMFSDNVYSYFCLYNLRKRNLNIFTPNENKDLKCFLTDTDFDVVSEQKPKSIGLMIYVNKEDEPLLILNVSAGDTGGKNSSLKINVMCNLRKLFMEMGA